MKLVQINATCGAGSTGKICVAVSKLLWQHDIENYVYYVSRSSDYPYGVKYMTPRELKIQALRSRILGNYGFNSHKATDRLLKELESVDPDIVHLHNVHGHNCDLGLLMDYLRQKKKKIYWTFHDCWCFTGYCTHYSMSRCNNWKDGCRECPQWRRYSWFFDRSIRMFEQKKRAFSDLDLTIITPSKWLGQQVEQSFLQSYPVKGIHNGIDLDVFKPIGSDLRVQYSLRDKVVILGVAAGWDDRKGLDVFISLADRLDENYQLVLVGTNDKVDKRLPKTILSIHRTENQFELAKWYSLASVFVNPTREDTFPTVNIEALACGTPVVTFRTGGSPESIDETCGMVVEKDDVDGLEAAIRYIAEKKPFSEEACIRRAQEFDEREKFSEYLSVYFEDLGRSE